MAMRPESLEHPERGLSLVTREPGDEILEIAEKPDELAELRGRIAQAKLAKPPEGGHCRDCWQRGWRACIAAIEG